MTSAPAAQALVRRAFPGATCGEDVVPGVPGRVLQMADQLTAVSTGLLHLSATMQRVQGVDWHGVAALAFRRLLSTHDQPVARAGAIMGQAGDHLRSHARMLTRAQAQADGAVSMDLRAAAVTASWSTGTAAGADPGESMRRQALTTVAAAREQVLHSGRTAAAALRDAAALAPTEPGWVSRQEQRAEAAERQFRIGTLEGVAGLAQFVLAFNSVRMLTDPAGYGKDLATTVTQSVAHPGDTVRAVLDVETWNASKAQWLGHLAPTAALGLLTGGTGVAVRGPSASARLLAAAPSARAALVRQAIKERPLHLRSALRVRDVRPFASSPSALGTVTHVAPIENSVTSAMVRDAQWANVKISSQLDHAAQQLGALRVGTEHAVKDSPSLNRKVAEGLLAPERSIRDVSASVNDSVRYTFVYSDDLYVAKASATVQQLRTQGFDLAAAKSCWGGRRYQGLNLTFHDPRTGRLFELQLHTPASWATTVRTHPEYDLFRDVGIDPELKAFLGKRIGAEFAKVPRPTGIGDLSHQLGALGVDVGPVATVPLLRSADPRVMGRHVLGSTGGGAWAEAQERIP